MKARIDQFLNSWVSKKLMVFVVACLGLFSGDLTSSDFVNVSIVYLGTQGAIDAITRIRGNNSN